MRHDGYVMFGTPQQLIVGGCLHGASFGDVTTTFQTTSLSAPTDTIRFAVAQSYDTEFVDIDLSGVKIN